MSWRTLLVLGGIGSGKLEYAESVLGEPAVRRVSAGAPGGLAELASIVADAKPDQPLLVTDLPQWLPDRDGDPPAGLAELRAAVRASSAPVVLVSSEVGLQTEPSTAANRRAAAAVGGLNHALAAEVDAVVLVVAGQPSWLKGGPARPVTAAAPAPVSTADPITAGGDRPVPGLAELTGLPTPDETIAKAAVARLTGLGPVGLGALSSVVGFAAGCQRSEVPRPWQQIRVLVLCGDHDGGVGEGRGPLAQLAARAGATLRIVPAETAAAIEDGPAMPAEQVESALAQGWQLAEQAADDGVELLVLASIGAGAEAAAAAAAVMLAPGTEPAGLLGRVRSAAGKFDDEAWMRRCGAVRDAVRRTGGTARSKGRVVLAELAGPDLAIATGLLLGAAARRTPVLLDGPVGAAAGLLARNLAGAARHWWLLPETGGHPLVTRAVEVLGVTPLLDLRLDLGDGGGALAALPLLQTALELANAVPEPAGH